MLEHGSVSVTGRLHALHAESAEHGIGLPSTKELDLVFCPIGAEQSSGEAELEALVIDAVGQCSCSGANCFGSSAETLCRKELSLWSPCAAT